jgi:outer membrane protein TolC
MMSPRALCRLVVVAVAWGLPAAVFAQPLTADQAVQIALKTSPQIVNAKADVVSARGNVYSALSTVSPSLSAGFTRSADVARSEEGIILGAKGDRDIYQSRPDVTGNWNIFSMSGFSDVSSARNGLRAAEHLHASARNDVALDARRQFYQVVQAIQLSRVNTEALRLSRDNERRVRALFEVGSVSKSDVLKAQVQTAQSTLDSLLAVNQITVQRNVLAALIGIPEASLGEIDTTLQDTQQAYDEAQILAEAEKNRPDIRAAEESVKSANAGVNAARFLRIPFVSLSGQAIINSKFSSTTDPALASDGSFKTDREYIGAVALNWNFFDGFVTESRMAAANSGRARARENLAALKRNLAGEVRQALQSYREVIEGVDVARRAVDSAQENLKLIQQKYNVGSATILDLIDAQVQLQRAASQLVTARSAVWVGQASIDRVRGKAQ